MQPTNLGNFLSLKSFMTGSEHVLLPLKIIGCKPALNKCSNHGASCNVDQCKGIKIWFLRLFRTGCEVLLISWRKARFWMTKTERALRSWGHFWERTMVSCAVHLNFIIPWVLFFHSFEILTVAFLTRPPTCHLQCPDGREQPSTTIKTRSWIKLLISLVITQWKCLIYIFAILGMFPNTIFILLS